MTEKLTITIPVEISECSECPYCIGDVVCEKTNIALKPDDVIPAWCPHMVEPDDSGVSAKERAMKAALSHYFEENCDCMLYKAWEYSNRDDVEDEDECSCG